MRFLRGIAAVFPFLLAVSVRAQVGAQVLVPPYFSGTNCQAIGGLVRQQQAPAFTPVHTKLWIQGVLVREWTTGNAGDDAVHANATVGPQPSTTSAQTGLGCRFDSTHFANGSSISVKFEAWGADGRYVTDTQSAPAVNTALAFGRYEYEDPSMAGDSRGATVLASLLPGINIEVPVANLVTNTGWTADDFFSRLRGSGASVVYINSHGVHDTGDGSYVLSDQDELWPVVEQGDHYNDPGGQIFATTYHNGSVLDSIQTAVGLGDPPYNSSGKPPIWLAFNDTCDTGVSNDFADAYLWPYTNAYDDNSCENQSELGWSQKVFSGVQEKINNAMYSNLQQGFDADNTRLKMYRTYVRYAPFHGERLLDPSDAAARSFLHVYGDLYSRLHGVYTGSAGAVTDWYR